MAKKQSTVLENKDGYRFVDGAGNVTAVMEGTGKFSLRDDNAALEVFETWQAFVKSMGEEPVSARSDAAILKQLSNMGLGTPQAIDADPRQAHAPAQTESANQEGKEKDIMAKKEALDKLKKGTAAKKAAAKPASKPKDKAPKELHPCQCGCGEQVQREFKQGHDARVHGWGKKIARGDLKFSEIPSPDVATPTKWLKAHGVIQGKKEAAA